MNVIRALFMRDIKVGYQWADMDVRGFEPVSTHKHWRPTRVPRIVKHIRRINYAHRLIKKAHRRTVLRRILFNRSKLKITHKPPSTHIHFQSMTVRSQPIPASPCRSRVLAAPIFESRQFEFVGRWRGNKQYLILACLSCSDHTI